MIRKRAVLRRIDALEARVEELLGEVPGQDPAKYWEAVLALPRRAANDESDEAKAEASLCLRCRRAARTIISGRPHVICQILPDAAVCPDRQAKFFFAGVPRVTECGQFRLAEGPGDK